jgi:adenylate cyclase
VLFSDIKGFTTFSENHSPEEVVALLNEYLGAMTDVILKWEGTLDKFIGDAIMVFWNAPLPQESHAELAVRCAFEMNRRLAGLQEKWRMEGKPLLEAGIGINTGEALVGNIGADGKKMDYTVIGDHVNLGSRIEALTRKFDAAILISEYTLAKLRRPMAEGTLRGLSFEGLARVIVKGKEQPVGIYRMAPLPGTEDPAVITEFPAGEAVKLSEK